MARIPTVQVARLLDEEADADNEAERFSVIEGYRTEDAKEIELDYERQKDDEEERFSCYDDYDYDSYDYGPGAGFNPSY